MLIRCANCQNEFEKVGKIKYCSKQCCIQANTPDRKGLTKGICSYKHCNKEFTGHSGKKYCSNTCRTYASHGNETIPGWRERKVIRNAPKSNIFIKTCPITNKLFVARNANTKYSNEALTTSSTGKSKYIYIPIPKRKHVCLKCRKESMVNGAHKSKYCTDCYSKEWRRTNKSKRRAIESASKEFITPFSVFERDKWTCQMCGIFTPVVYRGTIEWTAPELDHIIPVSKGGSHTMDNLQCLCRRCNINKSNKVYKNREQNNIWLSTGRAG